MRALFFGAWLFLAFWLIVFLNLKALHRRRLRPAAVSSPTGSFVYVVRSEGRGIKIGITGNPNRRLEQLRAFHCRDGNFSRLGFAYLAAVEDAAGAAVEREALALLARHRMSGEWFLCPPELATAAVAGAAIKIKKRLQSVDPPLADQIIALAAASDAAPAAVTRPPLPQTYKLLGRVAVAVIALTFVLGVVLVVAGR